MGEKKAAGQKAPASAGAKKAVEKGKEAAKAKQQPAGEAAAASEAILSRFRPKPRPVFFLLFALGCIWIAFFYDACDVKGGKKRDCGFSGIAPNECRTFACFLKSPGPFMKKTVKVKRTEGSSLGLTLKERADGIVVVDAVLPGTVQSYNSELPEGSEDAVLPGDRVVKLDGASGKGIVKAAGKTSAKTLVLEVERSRLPGVLQFLHSVKGKPNMLEKVLSSPGFAYFASVWLFNVRVAVPCWFISGYPLTSLPSYLTMSAAVAWQLTRCCHDENVPGGQPHCYKGTREPMPKVLHKAWSDASALLARVQKNPRSYFDWLFMPKI